MPLDCFTAPDWPAFTLISSTHLQLLTGSTLLQCLIGSLHLLLLIGSSRIMRELNKAKVGYSQIMRQL
jgi:hypothetical protein